MAIRIRRGNQADFDANKLVAGELGVVLDRGELYFCYSPGNVKRLQTAEDLQAVLDASPEAYTALLQLIKDLKNNPNALVNILNNIDSLNIGKLDKTGDSKDNVTTFSEAAEDEDIQSGESHTILFGKIKKSIKTLRYNIGLLTNQKLDIDKIVQTDTINDPTRVPASTVTYAHGQSIAQLNNNLEAFSNNMENKAAIRFSGLVDIPASTSKIIILPLTDCYAGLLYVRAYRSTASTYLTHKLFYFLSTSLTQVNTFNGSAGGVDYSISISQTASVINVTITNNESVALKCNVNVLNMFSA